MEEFKTESLTHEELLQKTISFATQNIEKAGGPFGALIARNGIIVATGCNRVTIDHDPTAHAEVNAIREACKKLGTFDLTGYDIYTSCEPCPMCLSAIYWAHLDRIFYAASQKDAAKVGFDDSFIYHEISLPVAKRAIPMQTLATFTDAEATLPFDIWEKKVDKTKY
ncbi:MAG: nucleoside deaminase [Bacteroidaceae bacterium]